MGIIKNLNILGTWNFKAELREISGIKKRWLEKELFTKDSNGGAEPKFLAKYEMRYIFPRGEMRVFKSI